MPTDDELETRILELLGKRKATSSICPSEVARSFSGDEAIWRPLMEPVRAVAARMSEQGGIEVTQKGEVVDLSDPERKGPIRLRLPRNE